MKIKELLTEVSGIFTVFAEDNAQAFNTLFNGQTPEQVNRMVLFLYGEKTVMPSVNADNWGVFVELIVIERLDGWLRQNDALTAKYDVLTPTQRKVTETRSTDRNRENNATRLTANKAFNDENFSDNERDTDTGTDTETETYNTERVEMGSNGSVSVSETISQELKVRQFNLQKAIIAAIVSEMTLDIY